MTKLETLETSFGNINTHIDMQRVQAQSLLVANSQAAHQPTEHSEAKKDAASSHGARDSEMVAANNMLSQRVVLVEQSYLAMS